MNVGKKNIILASILCISIGVIGVSFAYYTSGLTIGGSGSNVNASTAELINVSFDAGSSAINLQNVVPGSIALKDFSVTITPTESENTATYEIALEINSNDFEKCDDTNYDASNNACTIGASEITYTLKNSEGVTVANGDLTEAAGKVVLLKETKTATSTTTYNYSLELTYVNTGADQNHNANKTFTSNLTVGFAEE